MNNKNKTIKEFNNVIFTKDELEYLLELLETDKNNKDNANLRTEISLMLDKFD